MILEKSGNLLDADTEALVNAVNTVGVMGKGIALPALVETVERYGIQSIAIPALGCGHGGLTWEEMGPLIRTTLEPLAATVEIRLYPPVPSR
ncbi:macro domain-containing protein [Nocardia sp. SSK8]|uniref:macro domain-containing protein n=1 Tax=Nocardia sp. SSK8 TaxID=3120154 RepID=UPI00300A0068